MAKLEDLQHLEDFRMPAGFRGKPGWYVQLWFLVYALLFRPSLPFMNGWRRFLLVCFGAKVGKGVVVRASCRCYYPWKVTIGDHAWLGENVELYSLAPITIGARAVVSQRSYLCAGAHHPDKPTFDLYGKPIKIGERAWLATDVFVAPGVTIGAGALVGARSSVFRDLPAMQVCYGNPAKPVKARASD